MPGNRNEEKAENSVELSIDDIEDAAGGYILIRDGVSCPYAVVDDETGERRLVTNNWDEAKELNAQLGLSDQRIGYDEYKQKFGRRFRC